MVPRPRIILFSLLALGLGDQALALTVVGYNSVVNDRFASGYASAPVPNTSGSFVGAGLDLSGVGWNPLDPKQSFTMISDEYFVFATHHAPGATIEFFSPALYAANPGNPSAAIVTLNVSGTVFRPSTTTILGTGLSDLSIGKLSSPISNAYGITSYPILDLPTLNHYLGLTLLTYGHGGTSTTSPRLATNTLDEFALVDLFSPTGVPDSFDFVFDLDTGVGGESYIQSGDSGSPTFVLREGVLTLIGTHSAIDPDSDPQLAVDNFIPFYLNQMALAGVEFATFAPEPGRTSFLLVGLISTILRRRRN